MKPPYEAGDARRRVLYRIPPVPRGARVIEIHFAGTSPVLGDGRLGGNVTTRRLDGFPYGSADGSHGESPGQEYDMAVLHRTLDDAAARAMRDGRVAAARAALRCAVGVLRCGGVVAGCIANRFALKSVPRSADPTSGETLDTSGAQPSGIPRGIFSAASFGRFAAAEGIEGLAIYCLYPDSDSPALLLDPTQRAFRHFVRREAIARRHTTPLLRYVLKRAWTLSALGRLVAPGYFYFGFKA